MGDSMSTIINATTTNGVVIQPDNSGSLVLQTNSGTTALTIDTSQRAAFVAGTAALPAITTTGDTDTGIWFPAANTVATSTSGTEAMRIDSSGNLMVGTTSAFNQSSFSFVAPGTTRGGVFSANNTAAHVLQVNSVNASYADLGGGMLYIAGSNTSETAYRAISVYASSGAKFAVRGDGTIYSSNTSVQSISDARFKENIKDLNTGIAEVLKLQPRRFDWKKGKGTNEKNVAGFIAQEIETVFPELVSEFQDGIDDDTMYKSVGYSGLIPTLVKAIQEQQTIINDLKARVTVLEAK
jgi:hypothetical protein